DLVQAEPREEDFCPPNLFRSPFGENLDPHHPADPDTRAPSRRAADLRTGGLMAHQRIDDDVGIEGKAAHCAGGFLGAGYLPASTSRYIRLWRSSSSSNRSGNSAFTSS